MNCLNRENILKRFVLTEKYPIKVRIISCDSSNINWWYRYYVGDIFTVTESTTAEIGFSAMYHHSEFYTAIERGNNLILKEHCTKKINLKT
jgi:hypothetical protein